MKIIICDKPEKIKDFWNISQSIFILKKLFKIVLLYSKGPDTIYLYKIILQLAILARFLVNTVTVHNGLSVGRKKIKRLDKPNFGNHQNKNKTQNF